MEERPTLIICSGKNIINYNEIQLNAPKIHYDLPVGGKRLIQKTNGYDHTIISGVPV